MPERSAGSGESYYFNVATGEVERGYESDWKNRMGPYDTAEEAANALEIARARNVEWEEAERRERAWEQGQNDLDDEES